MNTSRTSAIGVALAAMLWSAGALAQAEPPAQPTADIEANLKAWGVASLPEIDALGEKLIPLYVPGQGLTPIDTSKCAQALPLLVEFEHKTLAAAVLLQK